jgi:hypothetical protein
MERLRHVSEQRMLRLEQRVEQVFQSLLEELHTVREASDATQQILHALQQTVARFQASNR